MLEGQEGIDWEQWLALAAAEESAGLDGLFRSDHYRSIIRGDPAGSLDAWTTLAALAASTDRIRLGTLVSPVTFRHVSVLAKAVVTVDQISGGRAELGIGAGWFESEHAAYGFPFMTTRERVDELDRQLAEITRQWRMRTTCGRSRSSSRGPGSSSAATPSRAPFARRRRFADEYNTIMPSLEAGPGALPDRPRGCESSRAGAAGVLDAGRLRDRCR